MRRAALAVLIVAVVAAAFLAVRGGGRGARSARPPPAAEPPREPAPREFLQWLKAAEPEARKKAASGVVSDALIAAVVEALDDESEWACEFLLSVGPRALPALEAKCLGGGPGARIAFSLAIRLMDPADRQPFLVLCLGHEEIRPAAACYVHEALRAAESPPPFEVGAPLRHALAAALANADRRVAAEGLHSDASDTRDFLRVAFDRAVRSTDDLLDLLAADSADVRAVAALRALGWAEVFDEDGNRLTERSEAALSMLLPLVHDPDPAVRTSALFSLGCLDGVVVPKEVIVARLDDPRESPEVRAAAAGALRWLGGNEDLRRHVHDESPVVRAAVLDAFRTSYDDPALVAEFRGLLDDPDPDVRRAAADALAPCTLDDDSRARLVRGLDDPSEPVRLACAEALCHGDPPPGALARLGRWLEKGSEAERKTALQCVGYIDERAAPIEMALVAAASVPDRPNRDDLVQALSDLPGQDERVLVALSAWTRDDDVWVRREAVKALVRRFPDRPATLDALDRALQDDAKVATVAAARLAAMRRNLPAVVKACASILSDKEALYFSGDDAIETLGRCGTFAREAVPALLEAMDGNLPFDAERALVGALAALPELADWTVPGLVERGARGNSLALAALEALGPSAEPHLSAALKDLAPARREAFAEALERLRHPLDNR